MRRLMWFAIGFAIACAFGIYCYSLTWVGMLCVILCLPLFFAKSVRYRIAAIILLGIGIGSVWLWGYNTFYIQTARQYDGQSVSVEATIIDYSYETDYGTSADAKIDLDGRRFNIRLYLDNLESLCPGDVVSGEVSLRLTTFDSLQGATFHQGKGIFLLGYAKGNMQIEQAEAVPSRYFAAFLRRQITGLLDKTFSEDTIGFVRALLLGDSSLLDYETDTSFKVSGIRHVIAVSGLHVSILFSLVYLLSAKRRFLTALIGMPVLFVFAAVAGFTPSVVRACIMQGLMILALLFKKEYDPPTALAFAVLVMLFANPMSISSVSFQLSVGCLLGIFLFYQRIYGYLTKKLGVVKGMTLKAKLLRWLAGSVSVTISAMIATTPLCAYYFGAVSLVGILTNLLTLWVVSFIFYGIMLVCIVALLNVSVACFIAGIISVPVRYVIYVAKILSSTPFSAVYTDSVYVVVWLVLTYALLIVFFLMPKKHPGILTACILIGFVFSVILSWLEPRLDNYRVTVFDVGHGQSILLQCDNKNYLLDCGGDHDETVADLVAQNLLSQGITRLDAIILTHYDTDHAGALPLLLTRIKVDSLYFPDIQADHPLRQKLEQDYADRIIWVCDDVVLSLDSMRISLFPGPKDATGNESCLSALFQMKNCDILVTGDLGTKGEQALLDRIELPQTEILMVGHHGSATSTGLPLLEAVKPEVAVISVDKDSYYGLPSKNVLLKLSLFDCLVRRTDLDGTIVFRG